MLAQGKRTLSTGHVTGPYFRIEHSVYPSNPTRYTSIEVIFRRSPRLRPRCYVGRLTLQELDALMKQRPWPLTDDDARELLQKYWKF